MSGEGQTGTRARAEALPPAGFVLLMALSLLWGLHWPMLKITLVDIPIWPFRSLCLIVGGGALLTMTALGGRSLRIAPREFAPLVLCALFNVVGWQLLSAYGVSLMEAGRAAIIAFTMPVWAALLSILVLRERTTWQLWLGLALGMAGLAVLIGPDLGKVGQSPWGAALMLAAAICWGAGTVLIKHFRWTLPTAALTGWQLLLSAIPVSLGAVWIGEAPDIAAMSPSAWLAALYVLAVSIIFCQWAWFKVVSLFPAVVAAMGTLAIPVVGVISGGLILDEPVGARELVALALVCAALAVVLVLPALHSSRAARSRVR